MSFRIRCPACKNTYAVEDDLRGKKVRCQMCGQPVAIPGAAPRDAKAIVPRKAGPPPLASRREDEEDNDRPSRPRPGRRRAEDDEEDDRPRRRARHRDDEEDEQPRRARQASGSSALPLLLIGGSAGLLVLLGAGLGAVLLFSGGADRAPNPAAPPVAPVAAVRAAEPVANPAPAAQAAPPAPAPAPAPPPAPAGAPAPAPVAPPPAPPVAAGALDPALAAKVKQATVYLRVQLGTGGIAEGSGFFAVEPGIVITNAHVLGMLHASKAPPRSVDVVVHSGEPTQMSLRGQVLGVDRLSDLAILRVEGAEPARLPAPLPVDSARALSELQKVYFFGFPFGARLGKSITVSETSISSLRKDDTGLLQQIQVNGNMNPGNSGGPLVDGRGAVVGVSVATIRGSAISFAVPADFIQPLLEGRHDDVHLGEPFLDGGQSRLPVKLTFTDPLGRIKDVKVEVWAGTPGVPRPVTSQQPQPQPGDGPRQTVALSLQAGSAQVDVPLPSLSPGQVVWLQPVLTGASATQWAASTAYQPSGLPPLERKPTVLQMKYPTDADKVERTLKLKSLVQFKLVEAKMTHTFRDSVEVDALERVEEVGPKGTKIGLCFGRVQADGNEDGRPLPRHPAALNLLRSLTVGFTLDQNGAFQTLVTSNRKATNPEVEDDLADLYTRAYNTYQSTCLPIPNRSLMPLESWPGKTFMMMGPKGKKKEVVDLLLTCTYEGLRSHQGRTEAFLRLSGDVKNRRPGPSSGGKVKGFALFDVEGGYISQAKVSLLTEIETDGLSFMTGQDIDLSRTPGNPLNITPPPPATKGPATPVAKGKTLFNKQELLTVKDRDDPRRPGFKMRTVTGNFAAGKKYVIEMNQTPGSRIDPLLRVEDDKGNILAQDDDSGGGLNARILFTAPATGAYQIVATSLVPNVYGGYVLIVSEAQ